MPRRRMPTRGFKAGSRNGHFPSISPLRACSAVNSRKTEDSLSAAMVRVRRRLKFGRKPPKPRCSVDSTNTEKQDSSDMCHNAELVSNWVSRVTDGSVLQEYPHTQMKTGRLSPSRLKRPERNSATMCSKTIRPHRKLDMSDSGSIIKLEESKCFRET